MKKEDNFGLMLKGLLAERNMSQAEFAKRSRTAESGISAICRGRKSCGPTLAKRFADTLNLEGRDRTIFLARARMPKWKGLSESIEATVLEALAQALKARGDFEISDIQAATSLAKGNNTQGSQASSPDLCIVLNSGEVLAIELKVNEMQKEK